MDFSQLSQEIGRNVQTLTHNGQLTCVASEVLQSST